MESESMYDQNPLPRYAVQKKIGPDKKERTFFNTPIQPTTDTWRKTQYDLLNYRQKSAKFKNNPQQIAMRNKKTILKKYTGKGGHYSASDLRQINQNDMMKPKIDMSKASGPMKILGGMTKRVAGDVAKGVSRGVKGIKNAAYKTFVAPSVRYNKIQKAEDDMLRTEGEAMMRGG